MAISFSSHRNFLTGNPFLPPIRQTNTKKPLHLFLSPYRASASMNKEGSDFQSSRCDKFPIAKLAVVAVAAGVLALGAVGDAEAAKSGGRIGGKAFRSAPPRSSGPRVNNNSRETLVAGEWRTVEGGWSRGCVKGTTCEAFGSDGLTVATNIFISPPVAPPLVGGYGYGSPFYGGWGWSPFTYFLPGPSIAVGIGGGFEFFVAILAFGAITAIIRRFTGRREEEDDEDF
ncbi:hypothetical protein MA16_Dca012930 [Dendrobium catenatum]|uniref:Uncharacterized protein n=1 Tax=Dendrobium catenatum TaxID=906689 RepID=A0A2I0W1R1_9ASPA|nr:hypothetical protein MA16_Dca012930 [Dendrobium catenatum]